MNPPEDMLKLASQAKDNAYTPYSKFHVGACVRTESGELYAGCNVENASYTLTIHAEGNAVGSMVADGHTKIAEVLIVIDGDMICPPCGACRQLLHEMTSDDTVFHLCNTAGNYKTLTMAELMPFPFGSDYFM